MESLNEFYNKSCKPNFESYTKITDNIILIDNFFENFEFTKKFFESRDKWKCILYQGHSKTGYESVFPDWVGKSLLEKYIVDNKIIDDLNSYRITCNFSFEHETEPMWMLSNSYPHVDQLQIENTQQYICLINLNDTPVSTNFYTYNDKEYCSSETSAEFEEYIDNIKTEFENYCGKRNITKTEVKTFLDNKKDLYVKLNKKVEYKPNQAIVYPSNLFHSPNVTQEFTKDNPRILLRIRFVQQIIDSKKITGVSYS